ncbi:unnamed protein product [Amoebophrya sp. A120]|nr:unnamed protein product [Amoebophrya sp. A120]|eukprot:GSA120T00004574001.1
MVVRLPEIIQHVLANPTAYPGPFQQSQPRTSQAFQSLDPQRQMRLIVDALVLRLKELLSEGQSVSIDNLGAFSFASSWHLSRYGPDFVSKTPCFVPHKKLQAACTNYKPNSQRLDTDPHALTTAQSVPAKIKFLNEVPLASGCYYKTDVVKSAVKQFFTAVVDLADRGYDIDLDMDVVCIKVVNKNVKATFSSGLTGPCSEPKRPSTMAHSTKGMKLSESWAKPDYSAAMTSYLDRPKSREVQNLRVGTANLGIMGRDLTSCA